MTVKRTKRRQDRRRHHQRAQSDLRKEHDRKVKEQIENVRDLLGAIDALASDPGSAPTAYADRLSEALSDEVAGALFGMPLLSFYRAVELAEEVDAERALAISNELASRTQIDVRFAWVGAGFAFGAGEQYRADDILKAATENASAAVEGHGLDERSDPVSLVARVKIECGRVADALELLDRRCAERPDDQLLQDIRASALAEALSRSVDTDRRSLACSCGSGSPWSDCCSDREQAALDRFTDRSLLYELRESLADFVADRPHLARWLQGRVRSWIDEVREVAGLGEFDELGNRDTLSELGDSGSSDANEEDPFARFAIECSWISTPDDEGLDDDDYDDEEDDSRLLIAQFASDPSTPEHLKNAAKEWLEHARYGFWQVEHPDTIPGLWLTDLVTRQTRYVAAPDEQIEDLARWSVLLGGVFPVDGVWRTGGVLIAVDPLEADRLTDQVYEMTEGVAIAIATEKGLKVPPPRHRAGSDPSGAPPYGVMASVLDEMESFEARLHSQVVLNAMPELVGLNEKSHRAAPRMTNTDGDPLELLTAVVALEDPQAVHEGLARHRDFETSDEESLLVWMGREMTPEEAAQSLAQFRAEAAKRGFGPIEEPEGPRRWVRGHLRFGDDRVVIEVNSQQRLERITTWLRREGVTAEPVVERKLNPSMDLGMSGRILMKAADSPEAEDAWRRLWLDEKVPALDGTTPRRAASSESKRPLLERLLRQFEHDGDLARMQGDQGVDVGWLRSELDMEDWA